MKINQIVSLNDEWYTPTYAIRPLVKYIKRNKYKRVWCPFDKPNSNYVKFFSRYGLEVIATHIDDNGDFFKIPTPKCDVIISNPPYSKRNEVLNKLFSLDLPFSMLLNTVGLFESSLRFNLFRYNTFEILYLDKRVSFIHKDENEKKSNPPFSSAYVCSNFLPRQICFAKINKALKD